jgi:hypothetical protein
MTATAFVTPAEDMLRAATHGYLSSVIESSKLYQKTIVIADHTIQINVAGDQASCSIPKPCYILK